MADLLFAAQFVTARVGKTGLTVTVDVDRYTISDGSRTALVTGGAATEGRRGLYSYRLASADLALYQYIATFITTNTTVDQQEIPALGLVVPDALVGSRLAPATAGRTLDVDASGNAAANVTHHAGVAVAAADLNGNVPVDVKLWKGSAPSDLVSGEVPGKLSSSSGQIIANATKLLPDAGMPAIGSVAYILPSLPTEADVQAAAAAALEAYDPPTMAELTSAVATLALEATAQAILEDTGTTLPALIGGIECGGDPWATALPGAYGAGTAGKLLSDLPSAGAGAIAHTITVDDGTNPLDGAEVWISTDEAGSNVVAGTLSTDALGRVTFMLDAGTYWKHVQLAGYNFTAKAFTVA